MQLERGVIASYSISLMIAKTAKPHIDGKNLVLPTVKEVIETVMDQSSASVLKAVSLSNSTVQRRIDEMGADVEKKLVEILTTTKHSLQVDESTLRDNEALLLGYVRVIHHKETREEMVFALTLPSDTREASIFQAAKDYYNDKGIPMNNIIQCATDGGAAMAGNIVVMKRFLD